MRKTSINHPVSEKDRTNIKYTTAIPSIIKSIVMTVHATWEGHNLNTHPGPGEHNKTQKCQKIISWLSMNDIWDVGKFGQIIQVHKIQC